MTFLGQGGGGSRYNNGRGHDRGGGRPRHGQSAMTPPHLMGAYGMPMGHNAYAHAATNQQIMAAYALQQQQVSQKSENHLTQKLASTAESKSSSDHAGGSEPAAERRVPSTLDSDASDDNPASDSAWVSGVQRGHGAAFDQQCAPRGGQGR